MTWKGLPLWLNNILPFAIILILAATIFSYNLSKTPVHLNQDELAFALNARSIADSLRDTSGQFLPFYFRHLDAFWATPVIVYLTALFLTFLPLSAASVRLPSVFIGLVSIFLIMLLIQRTYKSRALTCLAGFLATTTPALFIHSRLLLDNLYPVPFVLLWLLFLRKFIDEKKGFALFLSGLSLGIGIHSYHAPKIMMPIYFVASVIALVPEIRKNIKFYSLFLIGFTLPIMTFIPWLIIHPDTLQNQVQYIGGGDETIDIARGIWGVLDISRLSNVVAPSFFTYFSPKILFTTGDSSLIHSTHKAGAFLLPILILAVFGILEVIFQQKDRLSKLILFGFLTYPLAPAIVNQSQRISRGLVVIPFLVLLATYGASYLLRSKNQHLKALLAILLIASAVQFGFFLHDYHGDYRQRSYGWFNNNIGDAMEAGITAAAARQPRLLYIDNHIPFASLYSKFFRIKLGRDLEKIPVFFDPSSSDISSFPSHSILIVTAEAAPALIATTNLTKLQVITEPDGTASFYIYQSKNH